MLKGVFTKQDICIEMEKFTNHPVTVGNDPEGYGKVVTKFTHVLPCSTGNNDRNKECRKDHCNSQWLPYHTPGYIFE